MSAAKNCYRCKVAKPVSEFYLDRTRSDGICRICKVCDIERRRLNPNRNAGAVASRARHPERDLARTLAARAMDNGSLPKWPACAVPECDSIKVEAHHADYSRPLDVVWLCTAHHRMCHPRNAQ